MSYRELLIGCGSRRDKILSFGEDREWHELTTLDVNPDHGPNVVWDLCLLPLPFDDDTFDEIHAYEVLEHIGSQGDYKFFFRQFSDFWRILKPGGMLFATCPSRHSPWALGDPSHTRVLQEENLLFLDQSEYTDQIGRTPMSDFRYLYKADFKPRAGATDDMTFKFVIEAVKPSRISL